MDSSCVVYQVNWVLRQLDSLIATGPRWGTSKDAFLSEEDITARDIVNPELESAKKTIESKFENFRKNIS